MSEKKKFWQTPEHMEGFGQAFVVSEDQKLDWGDLFIMTTLPTQSRMPHLFPQLPLPLRFYYISIYMLYFKDVSKNKNPTLPKHALFYVLYSNLFLKRFMLLIVSGMSIC